MSSLSPEELANLKAQADAALNEEGGSNDNKSDDDEEEEPKSSFGFLSGVREESDEERSLDGADGSGFGFLSSPSAASQSDKDKEDVQESIAGVVSGSPISAPVQPLMNRTPPPLPSVPYVATSQPQPLMPTSSSSQAVKLASSSIAASSKVVSASLIMQLSISWTSQTTDNKVLTYSLFCPALPCSYIAPRMTHHSRRTSLDT